MKYLCETCALSDVLVRRYLPGERRGHEVHVDSHAFATANLGLSPPSDYIGGLYVQPEATSRSRRFFGLEQGDLLVHSFDFAHGVHLWSGMRYSLIFWFKESLESVHDGAQPWHDPLVAAGNPDGLFNKVCALNLMYSNSALAVSHLEKAATDGHFLALANLGPAYLHMHSKNVGHSHALLKAVESFRSAAGSGFALAQ